VNNIQHQETVKNAVRAKFYGHEAIKSKTVPAYPKTAEREFRRVTGAYMKLLNEELKKKLPEMMAEYSRERRGDSRLDDSRDLDARLRQLLQEVAEALERRVSEYGLDEKVEQIASITKDTSIREWKRAVKNTLGIDLLDDYYKGEIYDEAIRRWIAENVLKIKSLPTETLGDMRQIILDSYMKGSSIRDIQKEIQEKYDVSKKKAQLLARDQVATLNAQITKLQQQDAGCKKYRWSSSKDSRVRDCHRELHGKTFSWDDPPEMWYETKSKGRVYTGRKCHPGEDFCCRCVAIPVFDLSTIDVPMK
jgi:SPP1 gp7 family putative phage head morphogenesis protein